MRPDSDDAGLIRVMGLHSLVYCERLHYLEEVERLEVADVSVYEGRESHLRFEGIQEEGKWEVLELASPRLGLVGKLDALRRHDGRVIPYEYKKGRGRKVAKGWEAWPADALQISAYGMLVEECLGVPVTEGWVRYGASQVTVKVPLTEELRRAVMDAVARAKVLRASSQRPPVAKNDRLCLRCSLAPVCLPEEERAAKDPSWKPVRLFPARLDRKTVHVCGNGACVSRSGETLVITTAEREEAFPIHEVGALVLHGYVQISAQALHFCAYHDVTVHWLSVGGRYVSGCVHGGETVRRRLRQYEALRDPAFALDLARRLVLLKTENTLRYLLRVTRDRERSFQELRAFDLLRRIIRKVAACRDKDFLRGYEGFAGKIYFSLLPGLLDASVPRELVPEERSRRPPRDRFNALLSFGYALLYQSVMAAVTAVGLDPAIGFYHTPRSEAHPLVMDLMEMFRLLLWDIPLLGSINRRMWDVERDFVVSPGKVWLSAEGKRKAIRLFEERKDEMWKHPVIDYSLSYGRMIELEVRLLEKEWSGSGGLFARMRLR